MSLRKVAPVLARRSGRIWPGVGGGVPSQRAGRPWLLVVKAVNLYPSMPVNQSGQARPGLSSGRRVVSEVELGSPRPALMVTSIRYCAAPGVRFDDPA